MDQDVKNALANLNARLTSIEKHLSTVLPQSFASDMNKTIQYIETYKNKSLPLFGSVIGIMLCQNVLIQILTRDNVVKREEIGLILDSLISHLAEKQPNSPHVAQHLKNLRESINKAAPIQYPDWLQGLLDGEDPKEPKKE